MLPATWSGTRDVVCRFAVLAAAPFYLDFRAKARRSARTGDRHNVFRGCWPDHSGNSPARKSVRLRRTRGGHRRFRLVCGIGRGGNPRQPALADGFGSAPASYVAWALWKMDRSQSVEAGLRADDSGTSLSVHRDPTDRDHSSSCPASTLRCRQILADLIDTVVPDNARELADRLIDDFGSLPAVLIASPTRLAKLSDSAAVARLIERVRTALLYSLRLRVERGPVLSSMTAVRAYLRFDLAWHRIERFRVMHLDTRCCLIRDEIMSCGTIDRTEVYVREVISRALELGSASLILAHNHPGGVLEPSQSDIGITRAIAAAGRLVDVAVLDHVIVGEGGHYSFRANCLI